MISPDQIKSWIEAGLPCERVEVAGDGHHFEAVIVSAAFRNKRRVERHQMVYTVLGERMRSDIHALSMRTLTPDETDS
jgi:acid stress-induced BolA-like protein IbaG/YrbA